MKSMENNTQTQIIRQSSLKFVIEYLNLVKVPLGMQETVAITEIISQYVIEGRTPQVIEKLKRFDNYVNESVTDDIVERLKVELSNG